MNKIIVNLTHSFHFEDVSILEKAMMKNGIIIEEADEDTYIKYAEQLAIDTLLDMEKDELFEGISVTTEIL